MRSLAVLCAVLAMAVAIPVAYNAPAVSHQSRFDVKTSQVVPASIANEVVASLQARAVAPFTSPSIVFHQANVVTGSEVSPLVPVPLAGRTVYAGQVPTLYPSGSGVTHETRYDTASWPAGTSGQVWPPVMQAPAVVPVIAPW